MDKEIEILLLNLLLFFSLVIILLTFSYIVLDFTLAKSNCEYINGTYSFNNFKHYCDNKTYSQYNDGWDYDENRNLLSRINLSELGL